jgi:hypothetical protein
MSRLHTELLRHVAAQVGLPPLRDVVKTPEVSEALRLTVVYDQGVPQRPADRVATLKVGHAAVQLEVKHLVPGRVQCDRPAFSTGRYRELNRRLLQLGFDRLDDQPGDQLGGERWLLERAAVHFHRDMVLMPGSASGAHLAIIDLLRRLWPEALQELGQAPGVSA